jgi:hypothetical protein
MVRARIVAVSILICRRGTSAICVRSGGSADDLAVPRATRSAAAAVHRVRTEGKWTRNGSARLAAGLRRGQMQMKKTDLFALKFTSCLLIAFFRKD